MQQTLCEKDYNLGEQNISLFKQIITFVDQITYKCEMASANRIYLLGERKSIVSGTINYELVLLSANEIFIGVNKILP